MFKKMFNKKAKKTTTTDVEKTIMLYIVKKSTTPVYIYILLYLFPEQNYIIPL